MLYFDADESAEEIEAPEATDDMEPDTYDEYDDEVYEREWCD